MLFAPLMVANEPIYFPIILKNSPAIALGKCISLPHDNRVKNLNKLGVNCFYNWHYKHPGYHIPIHFIPMVRTESMAHQLLNNIDYASNYHIWLLFNECDAPLTAGQCKMIPEQAADITRQLQNKFPEVQYWVAPAVHNFGRDDWLDEYLRYCTDCQIDGLAIHYYGYLSCDTQDFINYLNSFKRFNKPIWMTEYGCIKETDYLRYYQEWTNILEANPDVLAWFPWTEYVPDDWMGAVWAKNFVDINNNLTPLGEWYANE